MTAQTPTRNERVEAALRQLVEKAEVYREDKTTPECYLSSGPYCGTHSFLEYSSLVDDARAILDEVAQS